MAINLAAIHIWLVNFANTPNLTVLAGQNKTVNFRDSASLPNNRSAAEDLVCRNIRIRSANYLNLNVVALVAVLATAGAIVVSNVLCLPGLIFWIGKGWATATFPGSNGSRPTSLGCRGGFGRRSVSGILAPGPRGWI